MFGGSCSLGLRVLQPVLSEGLSSHGTRSGEGALTECLSRAG